MRRIELSFQKNIRDIGGVETVDHLQVKSGRLFRGGFLGHLSEEDIEIIDSLNLTDIIDFRSSREHRERPDYVPSGVMVHNFPPFDDHIDEENKKLADANLLWFVSKEKSGFDYMAEMYADLMVDEQAVTAWKNFFHTILSKEDGVFYFHCSQGKDRAGLAAFMLEIALGIDFETAKQDYLFSNVAMKIRIEYLLNMIKNKPFYNEKYHQSFIDVFSAKEEYLMRSIEAMEKAGDGTIISYIKNVLEVDIDKLRKIYLE